MLAQGLNPVIGESDDEEEEREHQLIAEEESDPMELALDCTLQMREEESTPNSIG